MRPDVLPHARRAANEPARARGWELVGQVTLTANLDVSLPALVSPVPTTHTSSTEDQLGRTMALSTCPIPPARAVAAQDKPTSELQDY